MKRYHGLMQGYATTTSISNLASFGKDATATHDLAGGFFTKYSPEVIHVLTQSTATFKNTVAFSTYSKPTPNYSRIILRFSRALRVCISRSREMSSPVLGSIPIWPETQRVPLNILAVEYGPIAFGPPVVLNVLMKSAILQQLIYLISQLRFICLFIQLYTIQQFSIRFTSFTPQSPLFADSRTIALPFRQNKGRRCWSVRLEKVAWSY